MDTHQYPSVSISQTEFLNLSMSNKSPKKRYKLNLLDNTFSPQLNHLSKQQQKLKQFVEEDIKDSDRYYCVKQKLKQNFFKIKTSRQPKPSIPTSVFDNSITLEDNKNNIQNSQIVTARAYKLSTSKQIDNQINKILKASQELTNRYKIQKKSKVKTKSEVDNRHRDSVDKQKNLILKFIRKSSQTGLPEKKWEDLTDRQKYQMRFTDYVYKKTKSAIEGDIYERKVKKKNTKIQKFQNFILEEVNFNSAHKEKIANYFKKIRQEFKKAEPNQKAKSTQYKQNIHTKTRKKIY